MKMFEGFDLQISADGRRMIGRKTGKVPSEEVTPTAVAASPDGTSAVEIKAKTDQPKSKVVEFTAEDKTHREKLAQAKEKLTSVENEISAIDNSIRYYAKGEKNSKRKHDRWNHVEPYYIIASAVLGFFIGLVCGIYIILRMSSTTTAANFLSIIGMAAICFAAGVVGSLLLVGISYAHCSLVIRHQKRDLTHARVILERLRASKKLYSEEQDRITNLIHTQRM